MACITKPWSHAVAERGDKTYAKPGRLRAVGPLSPECAHEREFLLFPIERINYLHTTAHEVAHITGGQG